jgi:hypothetical protein
MTTTKETSITQNYRLPQDIVEQGKAVYQESIRRQVEKPENIGRMLVINVDSGEYVLGEDVNGDDDLEVDLRALARSLSERRIVWNAYRLSCIRRNGGCLPPNARS